MFFQVSGRVPVRWLLLTSMYTNCKHTGKDVIQGTVCTNTVGHTSVSDAHMWLTFACVQKPWKHGMIARDSLQRLHVQLMVDQHMLATYRLVALV